MFVWCSELAHTGISSRQDCSVDDAPPIWIHSPNGDAKVGHTLYVSPRHMSVEGR